MAWVQWPAIQADVPTEAVLGNRLRRARSAILAQRDDLVPVMPTRVHAQSRACDDSSLKAVRAKRMLLQLMRTSVRMVRDSCHRLTR